MDSEIMNSADDMLSMAPADLFDDGPSDASTESVEAVASPETEEIETPEAIGDAAGESATEELPEEEAEEEETPAVEDVVKKTTPKADTVPLPDGVTTGKNKDGKPGLFVEKSRWDNAIYPNHKLVQELSAKLGEPATAEVLDSKIAAGNALDLLYTDLTSADPTSQGKVVEHLLDRMNNAFKNGAVGTDPTVPFIQQLYSELPAKAPDAYASLRLNAARDLIGEMFSLAATTKDVGLFNSMQHLVRVISGSKASTAAEIKAAAAKMELPFFDPTEMDRAAQTSNPLVQAQRRIEALERQLNGGQRTTTNPAAQFDSWAAETTTAISKAIADDVITPSLTEVAPRWKDFPNDYRRLVTEPLQREVSANIRSDTAFQARINRLDAQARRATSPAIRADIRAQMQTAYVNRAKLAVEAVKGDILKFAATTLKDGNSATHARRQAAQTKTALRTPGSSNPKSLVPSSLPSSSGGVFDVNSELAAMNALFR